MCLSVASFMCPQPKSFGGLSSFASETFMSGIAVRVSEAKELRPQENLVMGMSSLPQHGMCLQAELTLRHVGRGPLWSGIK